jgi:hypothetical protein
VPADRPAALEEALAFPVHLAGIVEKVRLPLKTDSVSEQPRPSGRLRQNG